MSIFTRGVVFILALFALSVSARDWEDINQERQFNAYRWEEQQRFEYEQDRLDRQEWLEERREAQSRRIWDEPTGYEND